MKFTVADLTAGHQDLQVKLKREHQNTLAAEASTNTSGDLWYKQQAYRAINQVRASFIHFNLG